MRNRPFVKFSGDNNERAFRNVSRFAVAHKIISREFPHILFLASDAPTGRLVAVHETREVFLHFCLRHIVVHIDLLNDHASLLLYLRGIKFRMKVDV